MDKQKFKPLTEEEIIELDLGDKSLGSDLRNSYKEIQRLMDVQEGMHLLIGKLREQLKGTQKHNSRLQSENNGLQKKIRKLEEDQLN